MIKKQLLIIACILQQFAFAQVFNFYLKFDDCYRDVKTCNSDFKKLITSIYKELKQMEHYQKPIKNNDYLNEALIDIKNMGIAIEIEGKNATDCVKSGQKICYEAQKNYDSTIELCCSVQREYLNFNLLPKYHNGINLENLLREAEKKCSVNNFKIFKSGQSATCKLGELYYISPKINEYLNDVKTLMHSKNKIIKKIKNNLNMCYQKAWHIFLKSLDGLARNFTEQCIADRTGERLMKIELD